MHRCRIITLLTTGRHTLTQTLEVRSFRFVEFFKHLHTLA
jgi:hypothetical protein